MSEFTVRRFETEDAAEVALIRKTLQITNAKDYSKESIDALVEQHTPEHVLERDSCVNNSVCILPENGL